MKNKINIEEINYYGSILLGILFIILNVYKSKIYLILCFFIIFGLFYFFQTKKSENLKITESILFSVIICLMIYYLLKSRENLNEGFSDDVDKKGMIKALKPDDIKKLNNKLDSVKNKKDKIENDDDDDDDNDDDDDDDNDDDDDDMDNYLDAGSTFIKAYKNLSPNAIEGMTNDTKELIETQKNLMETLKTLGPVVKEGHKVLKTFENYFDK